MTEDNKIVLNQFEDAINVYLENNTTDDLCKLIFNKIPKSMVYRIIKRVRRELWN